MEIKVNFLDNLRQEALFDDFKVITDQPIRYKGDGSAPGPFDYFLASSALCAAYFVRIYCNSRDIPTENIRLSQNNIVDPEDRYNQIFKIQVELPEDISDKHRRGILRSIDRCTVKKVVQTGPEFQVELVDNIDAESGALLMNDVDANSKTFIEGKDLPLEETIARTSQLIADLGIKIEIGSWRNIVPNVWSLHLRDAASPLCFTNGKGSTKESALCSALGEFVERLNCGFFYNDYYFGKAIADSDFVHYPSEKWFPLEKDDSLPDGMLDDYCWAIYNPEGELRGSHLIDTNSGRADRGICCIPYQRLSDGETIYFPSNLIENLYVSNGMSSGNTLAEAKVQALSEIIERAIKKKIIEEEITLPDVPQAVLAKYPSIVAGIEALAAQGFPVVVKDASLGGQYPVMNVTLMNPKTGGAYAAFGAHPSFEVALERTLTELLQGRSFQGLDDMPRPTFNSLAVTEPENSVDHFIDSTGIISWRFFSNQADYDFCEWNFSDTTEAESEFLMGLFEEMGLEVYMAVFDELGSQVCRILVPGYSEIYPVEDLVWDNTNMALDFREEILNIHRLNDAELSDLVERLEDSQLDHYMDIKTLIGIEFDENTVWGQLTILELKILSYLALKDYEEALDLVQAFLQYNDNTVARELFYVAMEAVLEITLDDEMAVEHYLENLNAMFGKETMEAVVGSVNGEVRFHGLTKTSLQLEGLDRHLNLIDFIEKVHQARSESMK